MLYFYDDFPFTFSEASVMHTSRISANANFAPYRGKS